MEPDQQSSRRNPSSAPPIGLLALLLGVLLAAAPAFYPGYWQSLEGFAPIFNAQFPSPIAGIAAVPDLWRGTGSAAFLAARPLLAVGIGPVVAVRGLFALAFLVGGLGLYAWLRRFFGDRSAGLAALLYVLLPPVLATVYVRGSLADGLILALLPVALAGSSHYAAGRSPAAIGVAVLAVLWMWRTQAGLAAFATGALLLYVLLVEQDRLTGLAVAVSGIAGGLSLLPLRAVTGPPPEPFFAHFVYFFQFFGTSWQTGPSQPGWQDPFPFQLGVVPVAFGLVAVWLGWRRWAAVGPLIRRLLIFCAGAVLLGLFLSLPASSFLWRLTGGDRLLTYPWQVLLPGLPFLAGLAGSLPRLNPELAGRGYWAALAGLVLVANVPYLSPQHTGYTPPGAPVAVFGETAAIVLLEANVFHRDGQAVLETVWQPLRALPTDYNIFWQALTAADDGSYQTLAQLDQQPLPDAPATSWQPGQIFTGTYTLELPTDPAQANLRYYFGFYDWQDGARLPLQSQRDDKIILYGEPSDEN